MPPGGAARARPAGGEPATAASPRGHRHRTSSADGSRVPGRCWPTAARHGAARSRHDRPARRVARHPRPARALGTRRAALPVLPRLRGPRPASSACSAQPRRGPLRADRPAVESTTSSTSRRRGAHRDERVAARRPGDRRRRGHRRAAGRRGRPAARRRDGRRPRHPPRRGVRAAPLRPGRRPARRLGCDVGRRRLGHHRRRRRTSVPGVWAAGNVVDPRAQVITAAGAGSAAAIAINADLVDDDVRVAVDDARHGLVH